MTVRFRCLPTLCLALAVCPTIAVAADVAPPVEAQTTTTARPVVAAEPPGGSAPTPDPAAQRSGNTVMAHGSEDIDPLANRTAGKDIPGNVYSGDQFRIQLGGSVRMHSQFNTTSVGENVSRALLPSATNAEEDAFRVFLSRSRLNLAIQGPDTLGGKTSAFLEVDFQRQTSDGEGGAISTSPRLRHAFMRWTFDDALVAGGRVRLTLGQTGSAWDLMPDTVDGNAMLGGLGAANRRNPRIESLLALPIAQGQDLVFGLGLERPFFGTGTVGTDLGPGDLSGFPAVSGGLAFVTSQRLGRRFGLEKVSFGARAVYGQFDESFEGNQVNPSLPVPPVLDDNYDALAVHGGINLKNLGFNSSGPARTFSLMLGGVWSLGDAQILDAGFDRRTVLQADGTLEEAKSIGGFIQPIYYFTDTFSLRGAYGRQLALDDTRPAATGSFTGGDYVRHSNQQYEVSVWFTPGPFTFALSYNHTKTVWRSVDPGTLVAAEQTGRNDKGELMTWFTF